VQATWIEVSRSEARATVEDHALVLEARGIPSGMATAFGQHVLVVRLEDADRARGELERYVRENPDRPSGEEPPLPIWPSVGAALAYAAVLVLVDLAQRRGSFGLDWWDAGLADAALIRNGAWWRSLTALCLHADLVHLAGNLVFGALFGAMLAQSIGFGLAWLGFVLTGGIGNWLNAWLQSPSHTSIGASTAVFGMLGVQVAFDWMRRRQLPHGLVRRWAPIVIGALLLAWLGGAERRVDPNDLPRTLGDLNVAIPRIDVGAHILGFAAGLGLGGLLGLRKRRITSHVGIQTAYAALAVSVMALSWFAALR
jgi:membrane associated rhomboid family serine protease